MTQPPLEQAATILGRLLTEVSWEGSATRNYRHGGRGRENVLTAEVLTALDYLPRSRFLGAALAAAHGDRTATAQAAHDAEAFTIEFLPEVVLNPQGVGKAAKVVVQPDALLHGQSSLVLLEAKRQRASSFQPEQLTREYLTVTALAGARVPLLLLVLGAAPPVRVAGHGRLFITDAIDQHLDAVYARLEHHPWPLPRLRDHLDRSSAWITWTELSDVLHTQNRPEAFADASVAAAVTRMVNAVTQATHWHR
jgi:hypothetical protein